MHIPRLSRWVSSPPPRFVSLSLFLSVLRGAQGVRACVRGKVGQLWAGPPDLSLTSHITPLQLRAGLGFWREAAEWGHRERRGRNGRGTGGCTDSSACMCVCVRVVVRNNSPQNHRTRARARTHTGTVVRTLCARSRTPAAGMVGTALPACCRSYRHVGGWCGANSVRTCVGGAWRRLPPPARASSEHMGTNEAGWGWGGRAWRCAAVVASVRGGRF